MSCSQPQQAGRPQTTQLACKGLPGTSICRVFSACWASKRARAALRVSRAKRGGIASVSALSQGCGCQGSRSGGASCACKLPGLRCCTAACLRSHTGGDAHAACGSRPHGLATSTSMLSVGIEWGRRGAYMESSCSAGCRFILLHHEPVLLPGLQHVVTSGPQQPAGPCSSTTWRIAQQQRTQAS